MKMIKTALLNYVLCWFVGASVQSMEMPSFQSTLDTIKKNSVEISTLLIKANSGMQETRDPFGRSEKTDTPESRTFRNNAYSLIQETEIISNTLVKNYVFEILKNIDQFPEGIAVQKVSLGEPLKVFYTFTSLGIGSEILKSIQDVHGSNFKAFNDDQKKDIVNRINSYAYLVMTGSPKMSYGYSPNSTYQTAMSVCKLAERVRSQIEQG